MSTSQFTPFETLELIHKWLDGLRQETPYYEGITQTDFETQSDVPLRTLTSEATLVQREHLSLRYQYSDSQPGLYILSAENPVTLTQRHHKDKDCMHKRRTQAGEETRKRRRERPGRSLPASEDEDPVRAQAAAYQENPIIPSDKHARRKRRKTRDDLRSSKPKRKPKGIEYRKSGRTLNEEFKAPNVRSNRLSLTSGRGPGVFDHLKISAHRQKQDLPDLSFSEMRYLKNRPHEQTPECGTSELELPVMAKPLHKKRILLQTQSPTSDISCSTSPYRRATFPWIRSLTRPSSPLFWTTSPILPRPAFQESRKTPSISPESSATNHFLQDWTTNALLQGADSFSQNTKQCYSLDDLKALARVRTLSSASLDPRDEQRSQAWPAHWGFDSIGHDTEPRSQEQVPEQHHIQAAPYTILHGNPELSTQKVSQDDFQVPQREPQTHSAQPTANATCEVSQPTPSHIRTGPQYSSYWPSLQPKETVRVPMDTERGWHRQYQDLDRNEVARWPGEDPFCLTSVDTYDSHAYVDSVEPEKVTPAADILDRHSQALSDGLDDFDLELMQTDPVNFPPSERTGVIYFQHQGGWQREEEDNRAVTPFAVTTTLMTEPPVWVVDGDEENQTKLRWHWDHSSTKIHQPSARDSSWTTQSGYYASCSTLPHLPQKESPFKGFSRPYPSLQGFGSC
ncbi:uncharacterized protein PV06_00789 [Exophiala oligosperma]|uniref:Uncharacterized protein n=1 Tax=Exophiala oligosperma TaxID=215243 RepID=A0A0D2DYK3_9EURO|nr:uncharacterized protein PV06_00789 [Exophiala oligosperma]KIW48173.1 hypothetical protein PV06_00789 [Exophiala oligosperma]